MLDKYDRNINYLRISITDICNLRCTYCMPEAGVVHRDQSTLLTFAQICAVVEEATKLGLTKIRLTGGEPLLRRGVVDLVRLIRQTPGVSHLGMTTNGVLLASFIDALTAAGLDSLNVSLDTLDPDRYRQLTQVGDVRGVFEGIDAALGRGLPVKINMVVFKETTELETQAMEDFCRRRGIALQRINHYSLAESKTTDYRFDRPPSCRECNRIRLLADGSLKPCLHSDTEISLDPDDIGGCLREAIRSKPKHGSSCRSRQMFEIGG